MNFEHSTPADLPFIYDLYKSAIDYQKRKGYDLWPLFDESLIKTDIAEKRHWKISDGEQVACIFSVMYNDPVIWGEEKDKDPAVYLHRICINPQFKGKQMMLQIKDWAIRHAREKGKKYVRMDTWGNNENLRNYYIKCGFNYIGQQYLKSAEGLPGHYGGNHLSLFENEV